MAGPDFASLDRRALVSGEDPRLGLFGLLLVLAVGIGALSGSGLYADGDTGWHIAAGDWILRHRSFPHTDPFSFASQGVPWVAHEWLGSVALALAFRLGGFGGVSLLMEVAMLASLSIIALRLRRWATPLELVVLIGVVAAALAPFSLARPMVLAWPILLLWLEGLLRARERDAAPGAAMVALMLLWVNVHASFLLGILMIGPVALEALVTAAPSDRLRVLRQWTLFGIAALLAGLCNPYGWHSYLMPVRATLDPMTGRIAEFLPLTPARRGGVLLLLLLLPALSWWRGARLAWTRILLVLPLLYLGYAHTRHIALFALTAGLVVLPALTGRMSRGEPPFPRLLAVVPPFGWLLAGIVAVELVAVRIINPTLPQQSQVNPAAAFLRIPPDLRGKPLFNGYSLGGPLILRGYRPYIDGRGDAYPPDHFRRYLKINAGDAATFAEEEARWRFAWAIVPKGAEAILAVIDKRPGWTRTYEDRFAVIYVRDPALPYIPKDPNRR